MVCTESKIDKNENEQNITNVTNENTNTGFNVEDEKNKVVEVTRLSIFGNDIKSKFQIKDIEYIRASIHPFATFRVKSSGYYYIYEPNFKIDSVKKLFK